jgi:hypothetical protein
MPAVINSITGDPAANSYAAVSDADAYHLNHPYSATWDAATTDQKTRALITATRLIDEQVEWNGVVHNSAQALLWPRAGMYYQNEWYIPLTVIPQKLMDAVSEFARQILDDNRMADDQLSTQGITGIQAGDVDITFTGYSRAKVIPDAVYYMLRPWGSIRNRSEATSRLVRS